jgi:hypothetical protein
VEAVAFFGSCREAFVRASKKCGGSDLFLNMADRVVRLRFAGRELREIMEPSFRHLAAAPPGIEAALTILVWDHEGTGEAIPPRPWAPEAEGVLGRVRDFGSPRFSAMVDLGETQVWMHDRERGVAFLWVRSLARLASWDRIHPLRLLLDAWARTQGLQMIHAGAVSTSHGGGVLVVGPAGAGKSTTVLAMLAAGGRAVGDDYVLVGVGNRPLAYSIYGAMRIFESQRGRFPFLMPHPDVATPDGNGATKLTSYVAVHRPEVMTGRLPVLAIVMPRPAPGRRTHAVREGGANALFAVAPNTLKQLDPQNAASFARMAALCRALPCWRLDLGDDLDAVPRAIDAITRQAAAA